MARTAAKTVQGGRQWPEGLRATSGVKRAFSCRESKVEEGAQHCSLQVTSISHHLRARSGREGVGKSEELLADKRATGIREVADDPE